MINWADIQPFLFLALAGLFKAISDTLFFHFDTSVFKNLNPKWWNPNVSWEYVKFLPFTKYRADAWHISNSLMIVCFTVAVFGIHWKVLIGGLLFIIVFNLFYNTILKRK